MAHGEIQCLGVSKRFDNYMRGRAKIEGKPSRGPAVSVRRDLNDNEFIAFYADGRKRKFRIHDEKTKQDAWQDRWDAYAYSQAGRQAQRPQWGAGVSEQAAGQMKDWEDLLNDVKKRYGI